MENSAQFMWKALEKLHVKSWLKFDLQSPLKNATLNCGIKFSRVPKCWNFLHSNCDFNFLIFMMSVSSAKHLKITCQIPDQGVQTLKILEHSRFET